jgi:hypothetical protein
MVIQRNNLYHLLEFYIRQKLNYNRILELLQNKHDIKIRYVTMLIDFN